MSKKDVKTLLDQDIERELKSLLERASTEAVRTKLRNLHEACRHLTTNKRLTVPNVVATYKKLFDDEEIGESTIRNKRNGKNLYHQLYRKWENVAAAKVAAAARKVPVDAGVIGQDQIRRIEDPHTQHAVILLMAKARSLEHQLNTLKEEKSDQPLRIEGIPLLAGSSDLVLSDGEVAALRDFLDPRSMRVKLLNSAKDGSVKLKDGRVIADPGFVGALEKIVKSYERP